MADSAHLDTPVLAASDDAIRRAVVALRRGGLVVFPTETVYGLGADALNPAAVRRMFAAKGRPADHPVIVHLADAPLIEQFAAEVPPEAWKLATAFWPGPMTLVLRRASSISDLVTGGLPTVGLRVPGHPIAQALLREFGGPIAAPSANRFGRVSPTCVAHVIDELAGCVDLILDSGPCIVGLESTIIDVSGARPTVLRPGAVTTQQIEAVLSDTITAPPANAPRVSGSLPSHYAPRARVEIVPPNDVIPRAQKLARDGHRVAVLGPAELRIEHPQIAVIVVPAEARAVAQGLYAALRRVDELGCDVVVTSLPSEEGIGTAIADRLRRAAGPRSP